tara:strand:+ start:1224 stop:1445 length:222 start_codon:yes stop_codon:yes gene_type:complete
MQNQEQQINVNLKDAEDIKCGECENLYFIPVVRVKRISPLMSPSGEEMLAPIQTFQCSSCGHVNKQFLGEEAS